MTETSVDELRYKRGVLQAEIDYRRTRRTAIFTWANSVLIAVTGGVIALQVQGGQPMTSPQKLVLTFAASVLGVYSALWWDDQRRIGASAQRQIGIVDAALGVSIERDRSRRSDLVGGLVAILLLTVAAVVAIWLPLAARP